MVGRFSSRAVVVAALALVAAGVTVVAPAAGGAGAGAEVWVDGSSPSCSDGFSRMQATSPLTPWCSVARAVAAGGAVAGDTVRVLPGTYAGEVRPATSGTPDAPLRITAPRGGVTLHGAAASAAVKLVGVTDIAIEGLTVTGAASQGVWAYNAQRVTLDGLVVEGNPGHGVQIRESSAVTVTRSRITGNGGAGIFETPGTTGGRYVSNEVRGNGINGDPYNGDGLQVGGTGTYVAGNTVVGNGDPGPYEHGIYLGPSASGAVVEGNVVSGNAGSNVKAAGSDGLVRYNRLEGGRLGLVVSDNPTPVTAYYNLIFGSYQHAVLVTTGTTPARARLWNNTIVVTSRSGSSGDGSAIFVKAAASLDLRNNVVAYASADNAGSALSVVDAKQLGGFTSNNNWFSSTDPEGRHLAWNGARLTLTKWKRNGQDGKSIASAPPALDGDGRVVSANLGRRKGQGLGLARDYAGTPVPSGVAPDVGAYQAP